MAEGDVGRDAPGEDGAEEREHDAYAAERGGEVVDAVAAVHKVLHENPLFRWLECHGVQR